MKKIVSNILEKYVPLELIPIVELEGVAYKLSSDCVVIYLPIKQNEEEIEIMKPSIIIDNKNKAILSTLDIQVAGFKVVKDVSARMVLDFVRLEIEAQYSEKVEEIKSMASDVAKDIQNFKVTSPDVLKFLLQLRVYDCEKPEHGLDWAITQYLKSRVNLDSFDAFFKLEMHQRLIFLYDEQLKSSVVQELVESISSTFDEYEFDKLILYGLVKPEIRSLQILALKIVKGDKPKVKIHHIVDGKKKINAMYKPGESQMFYRDKDNNLTIRDSRYNEILFKNVEEIVMSDEVIYTKED